MAAGRIFLGLLKHIIVAVLVHLSLLQALSLALACHLVLQGLEVDEVALRLMLANHHLTYYVACHWSHTRQHYLFEKSIDFHLLTSILTNALYVDGPKRAECLRSIILLVKQRQAYN